MLLILAGVSISYIANGGIINKTEVAMDMYENANKKQQDIINEIDDYMKEEISNNNSGEDTSGNENNTGGSGGEPGETPSVDKGGLADEDTTITTDDPNVQIVIPKGFAPVILQTDRTDSLPGENGAVKEIMPVEDWNSITAEQINKGIVVVDNAITYTDGVPDFNEYVWIPISDSSKFARNDWNMDTLANETDIKEKLRNRIIEYMIPKRIFIIDKIPLTFNEKVDRKELLNKYVYKNAVNKVETKIEDRLIRIWSNIIGEEVDPNKAYSEYMIDSLTLTRISIEIGKIWNEFSIEDIVKYKTINNIVKHMENKEKEVKIDNKRINKILKDYAISLKDVELIKINENERMMLNFYFLNPRECVFQDCYIFEIESRLNEKYIKNEFIKKTNEMNSLKTKYVFGYDMKIQSKAFNDMVKYSYIELDDKNKLEKIIYNNEIEVNNINECSIKLKVISFENETYLIFNYPHIRMDELSFFDLVNAILTQILKEDSYGMRILNEVHSDKNIIINMDKNQKQKCVKEAKLYSTNINNIVEYHILKALKEQYNFNNIAHYILNINNSNLIHIGNNLSICSSNIENFSNIKGYINGKKKLLDKRNSDVLIGYNDISNLIIGKDFINFKHIENNGFNINIQIYNKKNTIKIIITLKEKDKLLNLEKLRNDFYANFN